VALTPCPNLSPADWLTGSDLPWQQLVTFGPAGFQAYARLRFLPDPTYPGQSENDVERERPPEHELLRTALDVLSEHTLTPDDCYFCLWEGWGTEIDGDDGTQVVYIAAGPMPPIYRDPPEASRAGPAANPIAPAFPPTVLDGPKVTIPGRAFFLFRGSLADFGDWGAADQRPGEPRDWMPDPAFIWPVDHAWCIADDVDPHYAGIGADAVAIGRLLAHPQLDVVSADPGAEQPDYR
jgi:hypothetical protein